MQVPPFCIRQLDKNLVAFVTPIETDLYQTHEQIGMRRIEKNEPDWDICYKLYQEEIDQTRSELQIKWIKSATLNLPAFIPYSSAAF